MYPCADCADAAPRAAGEMQNTQQTYGAVEDRSRGAEEEARPQGRRRRRGAWSRPAPIYQFSLVPKCSVSLADLPVLRTGLVGAALSLAPKTAGGVASLYGSTPNSLSGGTWSGNTSPQCMGARITPWSCAAQCMGPSCWPGSHCAT